jgi:hypothetical protein
MIILDFTKEDGDLVGNGPSVSDVVTEQLPEVEPELDPELDPVSVATTVSVAVPDELSSSLLHAFITGIANEPIPTKPNPLKKSFLFMISCF